VDGLIQERGDSLADELTRLSNPDEATGVPRLVHTTFSKELYFSSEDIQEQLDIETILDEVDLNQSVEDNSMLLDDARDVMPSGIYGSAQMQEKIRQLCAKYRGIFSRNVRQEPAKVEPMTIDIDLERLSAANPPRGGRKMSIEKQKAIEDFVKKLKDAGVISPSRASKYSYPTLTKKSNGSWRLCIDFRWLN
jgi:hypothetical protein